MNEILIKRVNETNITIVQEGSDMVCLPLKFIYGWLFTINPDKVKPESAEAVIRYKRECYHALFAHFVKRFRHAQQCNEQEIALLSQISEIKDTLLANKSELKAAQDRLARMRSERLVFQPTLFDEV